jgi:hypothetical protein
MAAVAELTVFSKPKERPGHTAPARSARDRIGLLNGAPDLAERREEILREEFAKRTDANR